MLELPIMLFESGHYKDTQVGGEMLCICEGVITIIPSNFLIMLIDALLKFSMVLSDRLWLSKQGDEQDAGTLDAGTLIIIWIHYIVHSLRTPTPGV